MYKEFDGLFAKIVISTDKGEKALKGKLCIFENYVYVDGTFQQTAVPIGKILRITKRNETGENNDDSTNREETI